MSNTVQLVFAGDAKGAQKAAKVADDAVSSVGTSATSASQDMDKAGKSARDYSDRIGNIGAGVTGVTDAIDSAGAAVQGLADLQDSGRASAMRLARAQADVEQATLDADQANIDLKQSVVDLTQAQADGRQASLDIGQARIDERQAALDLKKAQDDYNTAVKEHGKNSDEARQALIDLSQASMDGRQATEDLKQAQIDKNQAVVDGTQYALDGTQALRDGKDAQLNLNDAMKEADPSGIQEWSNKIQLLTPLLSGVVGVMGLVTAAQWLYNSALWANPLTWIIAGIIALIAVIVIIATKTTWFQDLWRWAWGGIKKAAQAVANWFSGPFVGFFTGAWRRVQAMNDRIANWFRNLPGRIGSMFSRMASVISGPFKAAFNAISRAWNSTVGRLSWTVPGWVPGIGGNTISAPNLPTFHTGGKVPGTPGSEMLAVLQAGEEVRTSASQVGDGGGWVPLPRGDALLDVLIEMLADRVGSKGGRAAQLGIRVV